MALAGMLRNRDDVNAADDYVVSSHFFDHDCAAGHDDCGASNHDLDHDHGAHL